MKDEKSRKSRLLEFRLKKGGVGQHEKKGIEF